MIQKPEEIEKIKTAFKSMQTKQDLMLLLNLAKPMVYGAKSKPFHLKQLTYYANPKLGNDRYKEFKIKKKNGGERVINAPVAGLKSLQRTLSLIMQCVYQPHPAANGFVRSKSVVDNAKIHTGNKYVYNIDLQDFFTSIDQARIWKCLQLKPFSLTNERLVLANAIAAICCTKIEVERVNSAGILENIERNVLPQGAPTSPVLSNVICQRLDFLLSGLAKRFGLKYSRYADDITFSSQHNVYQKDSEFVVELNRIIIDQGFKIKEGKTRLQKQGYRQAVTGIIVNEKVNVQKRYIKELRMWLYYWDQYGYERAFSFFEKKYPSDQSNSKKGKLDMVKVLSGKLDYLRMVKGGEDEMYLKLVERFDLLTGKTKRQANRINYLNNTYPVLHSPCITVELLKFFTANDKDLKYSTHSWEEGKYNSYDEYIAKIEQEWNKFSIDLKNQSFRLYAKILNFLFNKKLGQKDEKGYYISWGEKRLKFGWSSPELRIHMSEPGNSPFTCPIPNYIKELDRKHNLNYFKDYADIFKNEIEFREDSKNFKKTILDLWENELSYDFNIKGIEDLDGFSFFSDVHHVNEVLRTIFRDMFKKRPHFPEIIIERISHFEDGGFHLIKITQKDSFVTRQVNDPKFTEPSGDLNNIVKQLSNLADYSLVSRFSDGKIYRINYLVSTKLPFIEELSIDDVVIGFTHELKFYL